MLQQLSIVFNTSNSGDTATCILEDDSGTNLSTLTTTNPSTGGQRNEGTFTPNSGSDNYRIALNNAAMGETTLMYSATIIIEQVDCTKTEFDIPLGSNEALASPNTTYVDLQDDRNHLWLFESDLFDGTRTASLHVVAETDSGIANDDSNVALSVSSGNTAITNSELAFLGGIDTSPTIKTSSDFYSNLTDTNEYDIIMKLDTPGHGTDTLTLHKASIRINLSGGFLKAQIPVVVGWDNNSGSGLPGVWLSSFGDDWSQGQRTIIDRTGYSGTVTLRFEGIAFDATPNGEMQLVDDGTDEIGTGGSHQDTLTFTTSSPARQRRNVSSIDDGDRYFAVIDNLGVDDFEGVHAWVLIEVDNPAAGGHPGYSGALGWF